ncbi:MAG: RNA polymerase-binding protein DksA [Alphaproteobacteria bacterium]|nr:RNA polymerase-binding protein DksA [Alphaproteobacteria bacterium]
MSDTTTLPPDYVPNKKEEYMNEMQLEYFRRKLIDWKKELLAQASNTLDDLRQGGLNQPDDIDRASMETDKSLDLRTKDRARKLIVKIDQALERIEDGSYGYCEETGEEIGIDRLMARPIATLCLEAQERHERMEKTYDDEA